MGTQHATATWTGSLKEGTGKFNLPKANLSADYTFATRFEDANGTNPEELVGAALSSCYSMFLSALLTNNGFTFLACGWSQNLCFFFFKNKKRILDLDLRKQNFFEKHWTKQFELLKIWHFLILYDFHGQNS